MGSIELANFLIVMFQTPVSKFAVERDDDSLCEKITSSINTTLAAGLALVAKTIAESLANQQTHSMGVSHQKETVCHVEGAGIEASQEGGGPGALGTSSRPSSTVKSASGTSAPKSSAMKLNFVDLSKEGMNACVI